LRILLFVFLLMSAFHVFGTRPTIQTSNFSYNNATCISVDLQWTNGNGIARLIIAREGAATSFNPVDNNVYVPNRNFGTSTNLVAGNFAVYNATGENSVKIENLQPGKTYYFKIFEHNNAGASTLYLTDNAPTLSFTTPSIQLNFGVKYIDSCERNNRYEFTNTSTSTIPNLTYTFDFGGGVTSTASPVQHSFNSAGLVPVVLNVSPSLGCPSFISRNVRVYNKKLAFIDYNLFDDTIQCLEGNYFEIDPTPVVSPLLASYSYNWDFGDVTFSNFKTMKKSYSASNTYNVKLEIVTNVNMQPTSCKDTLLLKLQVLPNPASGIAINQSVQCFDANNFVLANNDITLSSYKWFFSVSDSLEGRVVSRQLPDTGRFRVIHVAVSSQGCRGRDTAFVNVVKNPDASFSGLNSFYCQSNNSITISPLFDGGTYFGYSNSPIITPNLPGNHFLGYTIDNGVCIDSTVFNFDIQKNPEPQIGNDTFICSGGFYQLQSNETGQHIWSTGETTSNITVFNSGQYFVKVTQGLCEGSDTIHVDFTRAPSVYLGRDTILCKGGGLTLKATNPRSVYQWNNGSTDSVVFAFATGKYKVKVVNPCGEFEDSIFITLQNEYCDLFMANAFSPGNDLINNVFMPRGRNINVLSFQIFNRWGEKVFETDQNNVGWDGTFKNNNAETGVYIWKLFYTTPNGLYIKKANASGEVTLLR
jgi:gliding motility-associated-like protein